MLKVDVMNHYLPKDRVAGGSLYWDPQTPVYPAAGSPPKPDADISKWGEATLPIDQLSPGEHTLWVVPKNSSADPVGIQTATTIVTDRIYRGLRIQLQVAAKPAGGKKMVGAVVHSSTMKNGAVQADVGKQSLTVQLLPVWMKAKHYPRDNTPIDMVIVHTTRNMGSSLNTFISSASSPHYIIDRDGTIVKLVLESSAAGHAAPEGAWKQGTFAFTHWGTHTKLAYRSIGIENVTPLLEDLTDAQYESLIPLIQSLMDKYKIPRQRVIGHSDVLTDGEGRLSDLRIACPGYKFDWPRMENAKPQGMGLRRAGGSTGSPGSTDPVSAFFMSMSVALAGNLELRVNDRDGKQVGNKTESGVFGGKERKGVIETPIVHLQTWLKEIG